MFIFLLSKIEVGSHLYINFGENFHLHGETVIVSSLVVISLILFLILLIIYFFLYSLKIKLQQQPAIMSQKQRKRHPPSWLLLITGRSTARPSPSHRHPHNDDTKTSDDRKYLRQLHKIQIC